MSFRKTSNRSQHWRDFVHSNGVLIAATGLPTAVFSNEPQCIRILSRGEIDGLSISLSTLTNPEFESLEMLVNEFFFDGWVQQTLTEFAKERLTRFGRHA